MLCKATGVKFDVLEHMTLCGVSRSGDLVSVKAWVGAKRDLERRGRRGWTPLMEAAL